MSHYSNDADSVRVEFFKPSGKWAYTEAVKWTGGYGTGVFLTKAFAQSLYDHLFKDGAMRHSGLIAVCLEPYHARAVPLMMNVDDVRVSR